MLPLSPTVRTCTGEDEKADGAGRDRRSSYPEKPVVPFIKATQDRVVLEIQRGCIRGCRFCQAGMLYRPTRERDLEMLKEVRLSHAEKYRTTRRSL